MKMNRVQFQPGLSMPQFYERYGTEAQCRTALEAARWPLDSPAGLRRRCAHQLERAGLRYWQCGACAHQCSLISGTIFESSKLALSRWFLAMQLLSSPRTMSRRWSSCAARCQLPQRLADEAQDHGGDARARGAARTQRARGDRRRLPRRRTLWRQGRPWLAEQGAFRRGGADHASGQPLWRACAAAIPRKRLPSSLQHIAFGPSSPTGCGASAPQPSSAPSMSARHWRRQGA